MTVRDLNVEYRSSCHPSLRLYAAFLKTGTKPKPVCAYLHGWHGNRYYVARDLETNRCMLDRFFLVGADMRGRGSSGTEPWWGTPDPAMAGRAGFVSEGSPDVSGWELNDVIDAIEEAKRRYPDHVLPDPVYAIGHSGGGGNVIAILGKFPDYFSAAYAGSAMSDYGEWARLTAWRQSIEQWIGATLKRNPRAFASRGGLTNVVNRITPIALSHGGRDTSVPCALSRVYVEANGKLGKPVPYRFDEEAEHGLWGHYEEMVEFLTRHRTPPVLPEEGRLVITGYVKTRRFEVVLPTIDSIAECSYDLAGGLALTLAGVATGTITVRVPVAWDVSSCVIDDGMTLVHSTRHGVWQQHAFETRGHDPVRFSVRAASEVRGSVPE